MPFSGQRFSRHLHVNPDRFVTEYNKICELLQNRPVPTRAQFQAAVWKAIAYHDKMKEEALDELCRRAQVNPKPSAHPSELDYQRLVEDLRKTVIEAIKGSQREVFNKQEAAEFLRLSGAQVDKLYRVGELKKAGNSRRVVFTRAELLRYLGKS